MPFPLPSACRSLPCRHTPIRPTTRPRCSHREAATFFILRLLSEAIKRRVKETRPDSDSHDSFPSGHATAAFAVATLESDLHPHQAALWYVGAALISYSRVRLRRHTVGDVVAGAALGAGTARVEVNQPRGLILAPFIMRGGLGMMMTRGL